MLPTPVMERIRDEFMDYRGLGASLIEISHRSKEFDQIIDRADELFKRLVKLPSNYKVLYMHGGARMQFSSIPMNLLPLKPARKAIYAKTGEFAKIALQEAERYGQIETIVSSEDTGFDRIPYVDPAKVDQNASYFHITGNNTIYGTRWHQFPQTGNVPLVCDMTSEILSRVVDYSKFGVIYAGMQKNIGPSGMAMVIIREDLLGHAMESIPTLLDFAVMAKDHSLTNTTNTFAIYVAALVFEWLEGQGGVEAIEKVNNEKARLLYEALDNSPFYKPYVHREHRSIMNVTFNLPNETLNDKFVKESGKEGLYALKGHRSVGGIRASIYNAMPLAGVQKLIDFMKEFERKNG
jgi:phosphoserine aminotransferase